MAALTRLPWFPLVWGLGFGVWGLGFGAERLQRKVGTCGHGFGAKVEVLANRLLHLSLHVLVEGFGVSQNGAGPS